MIDCDSLLAAVLANPGDDLARLVLAEWLDGNGGRRCTTLIRVRVTLLYMINIIIIYIELVRVVWPRQLPQNWQGDG